jgi:hypothetical protein
MPLVTNMPLQAHLGKRFEEFGAIIKPREDIFGMGKHPKAVEDFELSVRKPLPQRFVEEAIVNYYSQWAFPFLPTMSNDNCLRFNTPSSLLLVNVSYGHLKVEITTLELKGIQY